MTQKFGKCCAVPTSLTCPVTLLSSFVENANVGLGDRQRQLQCPEMVAYQGVAKGTAGGRKLPEIVRGEVSLAW